MCSDERARDREKIGLGDAMHASWGPTQRPVRARVAEFDPHPPTVLARSRKIRARRLSRGGRHATLTLNPRGLQPRPRPLNPKPHIETPKLNPNPKP